MVSTHLKNMLVKLDHFPKVRGENKQIFELPPPSHPSKSSGFGSFQPFRAELGQDTRPLFDKDCNWANQGLSPTTSNKGLDPQKTRAKRNGSKIAKVGLPPPENYILFHLKRDHVKRKGLSSKQHFSGELVFRGVGTERMIAKPLYNPISGTGIDYTLRKNERLQSWPKGMEITSMNLGLKFAVPKQS